MLALIRPVITSTDGRWVARIRCMPAARAFCARRAINSSTFLPTIIIMSANSSITTTMNGNGCNTAISPGTSARSGVQNGSANPSPVASASSTLRLKPAMLRTFKAAIKR